MGLWVQLLPGKVHSAFLPGLPSSPGSLPLLEPYLAICLHGATSFLPGAFAQAVLSAKSLLSLPQHPTPAGPSRPPGMPSLRPVQSTPLSPTPASPHQGCRKCGSHCLSVNCLNSKLWMEIVSEL